MSRTTNIYKNLESQINKLNKHNRQGSFKTRERYYEATKGFCKHLAESFGTQRFASIGDKHLQSYISDMQERGLSPSTIKTNLSAIRFFHDKIDRPRNTLSSNQNFELERRSFGGVNRSWTDQEYKGMVNHARELGQDRVADVMELARNQGLRIHEALRIDTGTAEKALQTGSLTIKGKNGLVRDIPLRDETRDIFRKSLQDAERGQKLYVREDEKTHLAIKQVQNWICRHREKFEEPSRESNMTFHGLRHSYAQEEYQRRVEEGKTDYEARVEVSNLLGHERDDVTRIYLAK